MRKLLILILIMLVGISALSCAGAADDFDESLINSQDMDSLETNTVHHLDGENKTVADIQNTIDAASEGDTIELAGTFEFGDYDNAINVNKTLTIRGAGDGAVLKPDSFKLGATQFFKIDSVASNVILDNLKFVNGEPNAVVWQGSEGSVINCKFNDNVGNSPLLMLGNNCNVTGCIFENNRASKGDGGAIYWSGANGFINNCQFINNYASGNGGAIYWNTAGGLISNCNFTNNEARGDKGNGGAILLNSVNCNVTNCIFTKNHANDCGGAVSSLGQNNRIADSNFSDNYVSNNVSDVQGGGAIFNGGANFIVDHCDFNNNKASGSYGGAIRSTSYLIRNSSFKGNSALKGNSIYGSYLTIQSNYFLLAFMESRNAAVDGQELTVTDDNIFEITREDSSVTFVKTGIIFEYGAVSEPILVRVTGGTIEKANIRVLNHPEAKITFVNNVLTVSNLAVGKYTLRVTTTPDADHYSVDKDLSVTVNKATAAIKASKVTVALKKGSYWSIKLINSKTGKAIGNMKLTLKVYTGKKYKTVSVKTNSKGIAKYQTKRLSKGSHKVIVSGSDSRYKFTTLKSYINVIKQVNVKFKVTKKTAKDGASLSIYVLNKKTKKPMNGVKVKLMIYTGKKYKTVTLKTKSFGKYKGICGYGTNKLSVGTHKVKIMPNTIKYSGSAVSSMKIVKSAKRIPGWESKDTAK